MNDGLRTGQLTEHDSGGEKIFGRLGNHSDSDACGDHDEDRLDGIGLLDDLDFEAMALDDFEK